MASNDIKSAPRANNHTQAELASEEHKIIPAIAHVEDAEMEAHKRNVRDIEYDAQESETPRTGLRRLMKRNPSYEFIRQVAMKDEEELDKHQVRRVSQSRITLGRGLIDQLEKKLWLMIVPALCIDYIFYYVDKT